MCGEVILTKSIVADYCNYCNRHQEKTMPETVFVIFAHGAEVVKKHCQRRCIAALFQLLLQQAINKLSFKEALCRK